MDLLILGIVIGLVLGAVLSIVTQPLWPKRGHHVSNLPSPRPVDSRGSQPSIQANPYPPRRYIGHRGSAHSADSRPPITPPPLTETLESRRRQARDGP